MSEENEEPQEDRTQGRVSWNELMTPDAEGSAAFYGSMFGWTRESMEMPNGMTYHFFSNGEAPAAGMLQMTPEMGECPPHWMTYITVENVEVSLAKALSLGAKLCKEVTQVPMGRFAILVDPQGAGIALWEFGSREESDA